MYSNNPGPTAKLDTIQNPGMLRGLHTCTLHYMITLWLRPIMHCPLATDFFKHVTCMEIYLPSCCQQACWVAA